MALIFAYPEDAALTLALSRLAREELRHFEQVSRVMHELGVPLVRQRPAAMRRSCAALRTTHPARKLDLLLAAALDRGALGRALRAARTKARRAARGSVRRARHRRGTPLRAVCGFRARARAAGVAGAARRARHARGRARDAARHRAAFSLGPAGRALTFTYKPPGTNFAAGCLLARYPPLPTPGPHRNERPSPPADRRR